MELVSERVAEGAGRTVTEGGVSRQVRYLTMRPRRARRPLSQCTAKMEYPPSAASLRSGCP